MINIKIVTAQISAMSHPPALSRIYADKCSPVSTKKPAYPPINPPASTPAVPPRLPIFPAKKSKVNKQKQPPTAAKKRTNFSYQPQARHYAPIRAAISCRSLHDLMVWHTKTEQPAAGQNQGRSLKLMINRQSQDRPLNPDWTRYCDKESGAGQTV